MYTYVQAGVGHKRDTCRDTDGVVSRNDPSPVAGRLTGLKAVYVINFDDGAGGVGWGWVEGRRDTTR